VLTSLTNPRNVSPGISDTAYIALLSWFAPGGLHAPTEPFTDPGDEVTIKQTHSFKTGLLGFIQFALAPQKNNLTAKGIGELMGQQLAFEVKLLVPGSYIEQHSIMQQLLNKPLIALVRDCDCIDETWYQVGTQCNPAYLTHDFNTGTQKDGQKGYLVNLSCIGLAVITYKAQVNKLLEYPENGYPVFYKFEEAVDNSSLSLMRAEFRDSESLNITFIYNQITDKLPSHIIRLSYRSSSIGSEFWVNLNDQDISTFVKFINVVQDLLPAGVTLTLYGTALLVKDPATEEHYVCIQILANLLATEDGDLFTIEDGSENIVPG
jgi:hypothetical protein